MGQNNTRRIEVGEGGYTYTSGNLADLLKEIDARQNSADCWSTITRDGDDLILKIEYFRDPGKTSLAIKRDYTRITGFGGIKLVSTITSTYYELDGTTVDSTVVTTVNRDTDPNLNRITGCDSPFSTSESTKL